LDYWLYFLSEKQKTISESTKTQNNANMNPNSKIEMLKLNIDNALLELDEGIKGNFDFYNHLLAFKSELFKPENNIEYYQHQYAIYVSVFRNLLDQIDCLREKCKDYPGDMYNLFDETGQSSKNLANDIHLSNFIGIAELYPDRSILKHVVNVKYTTYLEQLKIQKNQLNNIQASNQVFDDTLLSKVHEAFKNGEIWEYIPLIDFLESFHGKGNKIKPIVQGDFCYLLGLIELQRDEVVCPNMANWVKSNFGITEYTNKKKYNPQSPKRITIKLKFESLM
jgi:hypothetical protein